MSLGTDTGSPENMKDYNVDGPDSDLKVFLYGRFPYCWFDTLLLNQTCQKYYLLKGLCAVEFQHHLTMWSNNNKKKNKPETRHTSNRCHFISWSTEKENGSWMYKPIEHAVCYNESKHAYMEINLTNFSQSYTDCCLCFEWRFWYAVKWILWIVHMGRKAMILQWKQKLHRVMRQGLWSDQERHTLFSYLCNPTE